MNIELINLTARVDQNGIRTIVVPWLTETLEEAFAVGAEYNGLPSVGREVQRNEDGQTFTASVTYQGQSQGGGGTGAITRDNPNYRLETSWEEEPIESHPQINQLIEKYQGVWKDGRVVFPPTIESSAAAGAGLKKEEQQSIKNPMAGVEKWKRLSVVWSVTYASQVIPGGILSSIGKIVKPPGNPPGGGKWLKLPVRVSKKGNAVEVQEDYLLLPDDTPPEIYQVTND